jgi:hypothetical protein
MLVSRKRISTAMGLVVLAGLSSSVLASPPGGNQDMADAVATALKANPALAASPVQIIAQEGVVTIRGTVASAALKADALGRTQMVAGVTSVLDGLTVSSDPRVAPARFEPLGLHGGGMLGGPVAGGGMTGAPIEGGMIGGPINGGMMMGANDGSPLPEGPAVPGANNASQPNLPNYAWPSYAPHPNFSAVGYPTVYPWQAWPNIGPFYPYPEVPLDWRAVTLRWDDGLWWLDFKKHYTRPFFTPYPFGIFGY